MPHSLSVNPSLRFIQVEAKNILKACKNRDASCLNTLRYHSRFSNSTDDEILNADVSLQEVQHALSLDYGFKSWVGLKNGIKALKKEERKKDYAIVKKPGFDVIVLREGRYSFGEGGNVNEVPLMWNDLYDSGDLVSLSKLNIERPGPVTGSEILGISVFDQPEVPPYYMTYFIGVEKTGNEIPAEYKIMHIPDTTWVVLYGSMQQVNDYYINEWLPASVYKQDDVKPILEVTLQQGSGNQVWWPLVGDIKEVPIKSNINARIPSQLWNEFEDQCFDADKDPDIVLTELVEQYMKKKVNNSA